MNKKFNIQVLPLQDKLFRFAVSILKNTSNAEDALQEILEKLWKQKHELKKYDNIDAFAMKIMKNHCIDKLRQSKPQLEINDSLLNETCEFEKQIATEDTANIALKLIEHLPNMQQIIIKLRDVEGYDLDEIAQILEIKPNAVRTNLSRARQTIREQLLKLEK